MGRGNRTSVTDGRGNTTNFVYDDERRVTQIVAPSPFSYVTEIDYDADGRVSQVRRQTGDAGHPWQTTSVTYTASGKRDLVTHPNGYSTDYVYDTLDRLYQIIDPESRTTEYHYDELNRLLQVIDGNGDTEQAWTYSANGRAATLTDANTNTTTYGYDSFDRLTTTTYPDSSYEQLTLDDAGRVTAIQTRSGQVISLVYDELDRRTSRTIPGSGTDTYTYDLVGRLLTAAGAGGTITNGYDTAGRLTSVTYPGSRVVGYQYDAASNRTQLTYPDSSYVTYAYDELNRPTTILDDTPATIAAYTYDDLSRLTNLTYGNGTVTDYTYTLLESVETIDHSQWAGVDALLTYGYDQSGLQTSVTVNDSRFELLLNYAGTNNPAVNVLNQYTQALGLSLSYDTNGNLSSDGTRTFTHDAANRLLSETSSGVAFTYDPLDRRESKSAGGSSLTFIYDGEDVIAEYDGQGQLARKFVHGPGIDSPILMDTGAEQYYYHANDLGSVIALTDSTAAVAETYRYTAYGQPEPHSAVGNPSLYTARRYDTETGLYYYRARYYDPNLRRFLQPDPIGYLGGMNLYAYVGNSPVSYVDPFGDKIRLVGTDFHKKKMLQYLSKYLQTDVTMTKEGFINPVSNVPDKLDCFAKQFSFIIENKELAIIRFATPYELSPEKMMAIPPHDGNFVLLLINFRLKYNENAFYFKQKNRYYHVGEMFAHEFTHVEDFFLNRPFWPMDQLVEREWRAYENQDKYADIMELDKK